MYTESDISEMFHTKIAFGKDTPDREAVVMQRNQGRVATPRPPSGTEPCSRGLEKITNIQKPLKPPPPRTPT